MYYIDTRNGKCYDVKELTDQFALLDTGEKISREVFDRWFMEVSS